MAPKGAWMLVCSFSATSRASSELAAGRLDNAVHASVGGESWGGKSRSISSSLWGVATKPETGWDKSCVREAAVTRSEFLFAEGAWERFWIFGNYLVATRAGVCIIDCGAGEGEARDSLSAANSDLPTDRGADGAAVANPPGASGRTASAGRGSPR